VYIKGYTLAHTIIVYSFHEQSFLCFVFFCFAFLFLFFISFGEGKLQEERADSNEQRNE
jgi:Na+/H+ antiporter NhaC